MPQVISSESNLLQEKQLLEPYEKRILRRVRNKRVTFILSAYAAILFAIFEGLGQSFQDFSFKEILFVLTHFTLLQYFLIFVFLLLTIYFIDYFLKSAYPYIKDVKEGMKQIISFTPGKYQTPFFAEYYIETPIKKISLIKINKDLYDAIGQNHTACIHMSPHAKFVFKIEIAGKQMKFDGSNALVDM